MKLFSGLFRPAPETTPETTNTLPIEAKPAVVAEPGNAALRIAEQQRVMQQLEAGTLNPQALADLVTDGATSRIRQLAAEAIQDPPLIRQLIREARGKDKNAYRILKQKSDALLAEERQAAAIQADIAAVRASLERHAHWPYDPMYAPTLEHLSERWAPLAAHALPDDRKHAEEALERCRAAVAEHLQAAADQIARETAAAEERRQRILRQEAEEAAAAEMAAALEAEEKVRADKQAEEAIAWRRIGGLIGKTQSILKEGSTARAMGLRRAVEEKLQTAPGTTPPHITRQLQQLDEKLNLLQDWRKFAVVPKRAQLIDEMEALIGFSEEPNVLARQIKQLQEEWRTVSKGGGSDADAEAEWQRFHQAAQAAYQPCREYFEAQAKLRQENFEKRKALLERLEAFEAKQNWEQPDWRLVATALRESRREWYSHTPVERAAVKQIQESFDAVIGRLEEKLEGENARNIKDKKSLITKAQRLLAEPDSRKAIDEVKRLQELWKETGPVPRDEDRKLWEEFRKQCDAVFQKRQQQFVEQAKGLEAAQAQAVALCEEVEAIAALSGAELTEGAKKIPALREAFDALGELPRASARKIQDRFERAAKKCDTGIAQQRANEAAHSWNSLLEASEHVRKYRLSVVENTDASEQDALKQAAETYISSVQRWPKNGQQAVRAQFARQDGTDLAANEAALRMLCVRAEVLTDTPTPPEDQSLRREYQVKRLMQSMGQGAGGAENMDALVMEWIGTGPAPTPVYATLLERFQRCRSVNPGAKSRG